MTPLHPPARGPTDAFHPPASAGQAPGQARANGAGPADPAPSSFGEGRLAARADELIATARVEGGALRAGFSDPRARAWSWAEIADWERRTTQLVQTILGPECQGLWRRTLLDDDDRFPVDHLPGSQTWWAEYRLARRLDELDRILKRLMALSKPAKIEPSPKGATDPVDGGVDRSSAPDATKARR